MKIHWLVGIVACLLTGPGATAQRGAALREQFLRPGAETRPWTFWYWMYGAVSKEGITADLEAMKQAGLGGAYLMPIKSVDNAPQYNGKARQLSPEWWNMVGFSLKEAERLGLKLGMHICDGFALAGGPWIQPRESMQKVVWKDTLIRGGGKLNLQLPVPETYQGYYEDIALFALPVKSVVKDASPLRITCRNLADDKTVGANATKTVNIDEKGVIRSSYPCYIQYEYAKPFTCRNVEIILNGNNYQAHRLKIMASDDGVHYRFVTRLVPARQGWQNTDENSTHAIPAVTARFFRFYWTPEGSEPGSEDMDAAKWKPNLKIKQILLHSEPRLNQWEGKTGLVWRVAAETGAAEVPDSVCYLSSGIIDLTKNMQNGRFAGTLPAGNWKLLRMGHTSTGHTNATGGDAKGLECDKFSPDVVAKQFDNWFARVFEKTDSLTAHRVLKYMHVDSWECGSQNWSKNFRGEFLKRRGYDIFPYLPLFAGFPIDNVKESERILRDVRTTIAELVVDVFYKVLAEKARLYDCRFSAECVAPTMVSDGLMHYREVDLPMGEFWLNSPTHDKPNDMLDAISGAHIYNKNIVQAEGCTEVRGTWDENPGMLKPLLDRNYALGINRLFFHVFVHNPWMDRKPGMTLDGIGLFFQRDQTWWKDGAKVLSDYAARCQALLQYGRPVTDIAVFTGEEMPRRAVLPDRLVPSLPGLFGEERVRSEQKRLANVGEPLRVQPVGVTHSANMADPEKWINPLRGYAYDSFNKDVLLNAATVKDGKMVIPGGEYKVFVVPLSRPMNPGPAALSEEVRRKIDTLKAGGVIVPELPYTGADFSRYGLERDMEVPVNIAWTHRSGKDYDLYFLANQTDSVRQFTASMRTVCTTPEIWRPLTGEMKRIDGNPVKNGRTCVALSLMPYESVFIVLPKTPEAGTVMSVEGMPVMKKMLKTGDYKVYFLSGGITVERSGLFDWSKENNDKIRYYSGTAVYQTVFSWKGKLKKNEKIWLDLGKVCDVAAVRINGINCGTAWITPFKVDITKAMKKGTNKLTLEVTNTWANALLGADEGKAPFENIWTNAKYRKKEKRLLPAGLLGPLNIIVEQTNTK